MALGNNLKRIKKDALIPKKKEKKSIRKIKDTAKVPSKPKAAPKAKPEIKKTTKAKKPVAKKVVAAKKEKVDTPKTSTPATTTVAPKNVANLDERVILGGKEGSSITAKLVPSRRKTVRKTKLIFEGSLSLLEAESIKNCLLTTFSDYDIIDIQLTNITQLDIIPIQMIKLFINFYKDKKVKVDSDLPFDMKIVVERAGFGSLMFKEEAA